MSRKAYRTFTHSDFRVKVKNVEVGDIIHIGGIGMKVHRNRKNKFGNRVLSCTVYGDASYNTLILDRDLKVNVKTHETKGPKK